MWFRILLYLLDNHFMKSHDSNIIDDSLFERRMDLATTQLQRQFYRRMINLPSKINALAIADFILAMKTEANLSDNQSKLCNGS